MEKVVISVGGSVICPEKPDRSVIKEIKNLIEERARKGYWTGVVPGGGGLAREWQNAAYEISGVKDIERDLIGIEATKLNASLLRAVFDQELVYSEVIQDQSGEIKTDRKILVYCGWKPGCSTDNDAVIAAVKNGCRKVVNVGSADYVYSSDPSKNSDAERYEKIRWTEYLSLIPEEWKPGMNVPFDRIAAESASRHGLEVYIAGRNIENLRNLLDGKVFNGTIIR